MQIEKPPTIRVGVSGIDAARQTTREDLAYAEQAIKGIDWLHLFGLPPFQMFASERGWGADTDYANMIHAVGALQLYEDYCQWHAKKGYWPNEDPMGRLL